MGETEEEKRLRLKEVERKVDVVLELANAALSTKFIADSIGLGTRVISETLEKLYRRGHVSRRKGRVEFLEAPKETYWTASELPTPNVYRVALKGKAAMASKTEAAKRFKERAWKNWVEEIAAQNGMPKVEFVSVTADNRVDEYSTMSGGYWSVEQAEGVEAQMKELGFETKLVRCAFPSKKPMLRFRYPYSKL